MVEENNMAEKKGRLRSEVKVRRFTHYILSDTRD